MIRADQELSIRRQCEMLQVCRSGLYYEPEPVDEEQLELMRRLDQLHLTYPFYGSRNLTHELVSEGCRVNRKRVQRLMRLMGLEAIKRDPGQLKRTVGLSPIPAAVTLRLDFQNAFSNSS